jgi:hypothetical protein
MSNQTHELDMDLVQRILWDERVRQAGHLLEQTCFNINNYPLTSIDIRVKNEMDRIRSMLPKLAFAIRYPKQAEENKTLDT